MRGRRNLDGGEEEVADADVRRALRARSLRLIALTGLVTLAGGAALWALLAP